MNKIKPIKISKNEINSELGFSRLDVKFKGDDLNYVIVNSIKRMIQSIIAIYSFNSFDITSNTSVFNNNYIKGHIQNIPVWGIENKLDDHPEQVFLEGRAGDLAIFNSHLWHGSYINKSGEKRRAYHCYFVARQFPQQTNQKLYLDKDVKSKMDPVSKYILDID